MLGRASSYTRRAVAWCSEDLRISGIINIPRGKGPSRCGFCCTATGGSATYDALQQEGKDATLFVYDGEEHAFEPQRPLSMRRTVRSSTVTSPEAPVGVPRAPR